jgi:hypothetical protein
VFDDDHFDSGWGDQPTPWLRRPVIRAGITFFVIFSFVLLTLMSTCSPRTVPVGTTTTTLERVTALNW